MLMGLKAEGDESEKGKQPEAGSARLAMIGRYEE